MRVIDVGLREGYEYTVRDTFWTLPNVITLARFALIPVFVWLTATEQYLAAFWVLAALSSTDWVDGFVARRWDMISTTGTWLDPLADRLSMIIVAATLVLTGVAPDWIVWAIVVPDLVLSTVSLALFRGSPELDVSVLGKVRTALLLVAAPVLLLGNVPSLTDTAWGSAGLWLLSLGAIAHMLAAADYLRRFRAKAAELRARGIDPRDRTAWSEQSAERREASGTAPAGEDGAGPQSVSGAVHVARLSRSEPPEGRHPRGAGDGGRGPKTTHHPGAPSS